MLIRIKKAWEISENDVAPEHVYINRRSLMKGMAGLIAGGGLAACSDGGAAAPEAESPASDAHLGPMAGAPVDPPELSYTTNAAYDGGRAVTPEKTSTTYNNFYEFGSHKSIAQEADKQLKPRPWQIAIDGEVERPMLLDVDDLIARMDLEERIYRHRCVERWAITVPWIGFPVRKLIDLARPLSSAKYLRMETFGNPDFASGIRNQDWYPWPYVEGMTMAEASNDLSLLVVGVYGKIVPNAMGAPIRLHLPWKYGFKSIKSIVRFTFTAERPLSFWQEIAANEYGFWANINPDVPHPRWSQAQEQLLGTAEVVPTQIFNGYGEAVADLYAGLADEPLYR
ncbi:MAG: protein-methionine-sulfoxide reductase catalytic subunit MsrP [Alphaproteobacteria bacterium]|nr:protein-methionine-sulfoxide reductase catalytic subunit MsrP [Alphaproteobacteria bacterium]